MFYVCVGVLCVLCKLVKYSVRTRAVLGTSTHIVPYGHDLVQYLYGCLFHLPSLDTATTAVESHTDAPLAVPKPIHIDSKVQAPKFKTALTRACAFELLLWIVSTRDVMIQLAGPTGPDTLFPIVANTNTSSGEQIQLCNPVDIQHLIELGLTDLCTMLVTQLDYNTIHCRNPTEWNYDPMLNSQSECGHVGLVNKGSTCYVNALIQQLFMIPTFRQSILSLECQVPIYTLYPLVFVFFWFYSKFFV